MPSVPLMRARPSLALSSTGVRPAAASASAAGISVPAASRTSPSPISASAQCDNGARSPEQPSEPYSRTTGVMPADSSAGHQLGGLAADAGVPGRQRREPQQHQCAHHLALDLGARARQRASAPATAAAARASRPGCGGWPGRRNRSRCRTPGRSPPPAPRPPLAPCRSPRPRRRSARPGRRRGPPPPRRRSTSGRHLPAPSWPHATPARPSERQRAGAAAVSDARLGPPPVEEGRSPVTRPGEMTADPVTGFRDRR